MSPPPVALLPPCPCGTGTPYDGCCGPLLRRATEAATPEELMRSRYTAYAVGGRLGIDHLFRTWHPRTRPIEVAVDPTTTWTGLEVLEATGDEVEFRAHHERGGVPGVLHERSRFERRRGRWVYVGAIGSSSPA